MTMLFSDDYFIRSYLKCIVINYYNIGINKKKNTIKLKKWF